MAKRTEHEETKESVGVSVRVPQSVLAEIDALATQERRSRGNVIRILLEDALAERRKPS